MQHTNMIYHFQPLSLRGGRAGVEPTQTTFRSTAALNANAYQDFANRFDEECGDTVLAREQGDDEEEYEDCGTETASEHGECESEAASEHDECESEEGNGEKCCLCCEDTQHWAVGGCGHRVVCGVCALRMRVLLNSTECVMCKHPQPFVIVTNVECAFEDLNTSAMMLDTSAGIYYDNAIVYARMMALKSFNWYQYTSVL